MPLQSRKPVISAVLFDMDGTLLRAPHVGVYTTLCR